MQGPGFSTQDYIQKRPGIFHLTVSPLRKLHFQTNSLPCASKMSERSIGFSHNSSVTLVNYYAISRSPIKLIDLSFIGQDWQGLGQVFIPKQPQQATEMQHCLWSHLCHMPKPGTRLMWTVPPWLRPVKMTGTPQKRQPSQYLWADGKQRKTEFHYNLERNVSNFPAVHVTVRDGNS